MAYLIVSVIVVLLAIFVSAASQGNKKAKTRSTQPKITVTFSGQAENTDREQKKKPEYRFIKVRFFRYNENGESAELQDYINKRVMPKGQEYNFKVPKDFDCANGDVLSGESRFDSYGYMVVTDSDASDDYSGYTKVLHAEVFKIFNNQLVPKDELNDATTIAFTEKLPIFANKYVAVSNLPSALLGFVGRLVVRSGGTLQAPVTKRVSYLIEISKKNESKKAARAKEFGTPVLYLEDIVSLCKSACDDDKQVEAAGHKKTADEQ